MSMLNLVDTVSDIASPIGGIPRFGRLHGDIYVCKKCVIGDGIGTVGGMAVVLALVEAAETRDMLHMALTLLACALHQNPQNVREMQINRGYYLLSLFLYRRMSLFDMQSLEIFFQIATCEASFSEPKKLDVLRGGFDKLLTGNLSAFFEWFHIFEQDVNKVLEYCGKIMWVQYIVGSTKFPRVRIKGMDGLRRREMGRKSKDTSKIDSRHWEQVNEWRIFLELVHDAMSTELRVVRQDKYGWVLHAESEWQTHLQKLVHERGIFPTRKSSTDEDPEWQLCPIEGPYRMHKKLERCKLKIDIIQNVLNGQFELGELELSKDKTENDPSAFDVVSDSFFNVLTDNANNKSFDGELYDESIFKESDDARDVASSRNDDHDSSIYDENLQSAAEFSVKSSAVDILKAESVQGKSDLESPGQSILVKIEDVKVAEEKIDKELNDNGEYLIKPYLEPLEKIMY